MAPAMVTPPAVFETVKATVPANCDPLTVSDHAPWLVVPLIVTEDWSDKTSLVMLPPVDGNAVAPMVNGPETTVPDCDSVIVKLSRAPIVTLPQRDATAELLGVQEVI